MHLRGCPILFSDSGSSYRLIESYCVTATACMFGHALTRTPVWLIRPRFARSVRVRLLSLVSSGCLLSPSQTEPGALCRTRRRPSRVRRLLRYVLRGRFLRFYMRGTSAFHSFSDVLCCGIPEHLALEVSRDILQLRDMKRHGSSSFVAYIVLQCAVCALSINNTSTSSSFTAQSITECACPVQSSQPCVHMRSVGGTGMPRRSL